jgi:hypothetical protein
MRYSTLIALAFFLLSLGTFGQAPVEPCVSDEAMASLLSNSPEDARSFAAVQEALRNLQAQMANDRTDLEVYTLPVVVHVMHLGSEVGVDENISDEQIHSAIQALNEDFRKMPGTNGDGNGVDTFIQFELAKRDPDNNPTTGITRHNCSGIADYANNGIAAQSLASGAPEETIKSISSWDRDNYINIWVVNKINGGSANGYAYTFRTYNPIVDGLVVRHQKFGTTGSVTTGHRNRTTTHEMGHHLFLEHTFKDTYSCNAETNCETQGDQVCDTPATTRNTFCEAECPEAQVENYLDYSGEVCRNMFTAGQRDRMRACLADDRKSLTESLGGLIVVDEDLVISSVVSPSENTCQPSVNPVLEIKNQGVVTIDGCEVSYSLNNGPTFKNIFNQPIESAGTISVTLPELALNDSANELIMSVKKLGGLEDGFPANDTLRYSIELVESDHWTMNLTTDFFAPETSWTLTDEGGNVVWSDNAYPLGSADYEYSSCMATGCYTLTFYDSGDDGFKYSGSMTLTNGSGEVLAEINEENDDFGSQISFNVCATVAETAGCADANGNGMCDDAEVAGCLDINACNFNSQAIMDDGNCTYAEGLYDCNGACVDDADGDGICDALETEGCTSANACNYIASATDDDGSCEFPDTYYDCSGNCLNDTDGDGVCNELEVAGCQEPSACNYNPNATDSGNCQYAQPNYNCDGSCINDSDGDGVCNEFEVSGCQDSSACNYNASATDDDGSCEFAQPYLDCNGQCNNDSDGDGVCDELEVAGCQDASACNYNANATDSGTCNYANTYYNCDGSCIADADGDNVCDELEISGCTASAALNYDPVATDDDGSCEFPLDGCMDATACNYNPIATTDTGDCTYAEANYTCTGQCINDTDFDGICDEFEVVGCMDAEACNYDASATDEGTCDYASEFLNCDGTCINDMDGDGVCDELEVVGCMDASACNYNADATDAAECDYPEALMDCNGDCLNDVDGDGICDELEVGGCMDDTACNYDATATTDDGSCEYAAEGYDCEGNEVDSVGSLSESANISLFPNPMNPDHSMVFLSGLQNENTTIRVIATDGRVAWEGTGITTSPGVVGYPIRESITQGTYFIQVGSSNPFGSIPLMVW